MDRVFRITAYTNYGYGRGWEYPKKYLYDSEKAYNKQLKTKNTQHSSYHIKTKLVCEEFVNNSWVLIEERFYG